MPYFRKQSGRGQYKDIHWWVYTLDTPINGCSRVYCMPYAITEAMLMAASSGNTTRSASAPDLDKRGTGNIHPSINDVEAAAKDLRVRQLVLCTWHEGIRQYGPALTAAMKCDGEVYHHCNADVPAANYYPMITRPEHLTEEEQMKQELLRQVAILCEKNGVPLDENII